MAESAHLFLVRVSYGSATIVEANVRVTPKLYIVEGCATIHGTNYDFWSGSHLRKAESHAFETKTEALEYAHTCLQSAVDAHNQTIDRIVDEMGVLWDKMMDELPINEGWREAGG